MVDESAFRNDLMLFQQLQQQLQVYTMQKQQLQMQQKETEKALEDVEKTASGKPLFRFVGSVIVPKDKNALVIELKAEKTEISSRIELMDKQESKIKEKLNELKKKLEEAEKQLKK